MSGHNTINILLSERDRLVTRLTAERMNTWAAETLLLRVTKLLPHLIADSPFNAVARDTLEQEIRELLAEDRDHGPGFIPPAGPEPAA